MKYILGRLIQQFCLKRQGGIVAVGGYLKNDIPDVSTEWKRSIIGFGSRDIPI